MYVAKFTRNGVKWTVTLLEKKWSEEMSANEVNNIDSKKFLFRFSGRRWIYKRIYNNLIDNNELEIING